jgi:hypothetical protein
MTIEEIKKINQEKGKSFFSPKTMKFFHSRVLSQVFSGKDKYYFVTSEKFPNGNRAYTVRRFDAKSGEIDTVGLFNVLSKKEALLFAKKFVYNQNKS